MDRNSMLDHHALLSRYIGHRVCVTLYGQNKIWGRVANVCHDSVRMIETYIVSDLDEQEWLNQALYSGEDSSRPCYEETVVQVNHIISITCVDDDLEAPDDCEPVTVDAEPALSAIPCPPTGLDAFADQIVGQERICIEIGGVLLHRLFSSDSREFVQQVERLRTDLSRDPGIWLPPVRLRDNVRIPSTAYRILINGNVVCHAEALPDNCLSISPDRSDDRRWVTTEQAEYERAAGRIVLDARTVIVCRLAEAVRDHAGELLSLEDVRRIIDGIRPNAPALVEELFPHSLSLGLLRRVLSLWLEEHGSLKSLVRILESLAATQRVGSRDPEELLIRLRSDLAREICTPFIRDGRLPVVVFDGPLEQIIWRSIRGQRVGLPADTLEVLAGRIAGVWDHGNSQKRITLLVDSQVRRPLREALCRHLPHLAALGYSEIPRGIEVVPVGIVTAEGLDVSADEPAGWSCLIGRPHLPAANPSLDDTLTRYAAKNRDVRLRGDAREVTGQR